MDPGQRLPRYKDQITDNDGENHLDRPLNVIRRPATGRRRVPVDAPPSVAHHDHPQQHPHQQQPAAAVLPTYKDQANYVAAPNISRRHGTNSSRNESGAGNTSAIATPITDRGDRNLISRPQKRGPDGRLPDYKDQARSAVIRQIGEHEEVATNVVAMNTNLPNYKDQVRGATDHGIRNPPLPVSKPKHSNPPRPQQHQLLIRQSQQSQQLQPLEEILPDFKDQVHSAMNVRVKTAEQLQMDNNIEEPLPNYKDQVFERNRNDRDRLLPTKASRKDTNLRSISQHHYAGDEQQHQQEQLQQQQQMLPDYKDQVQSVLQVNATENRDGIGDYLKLPQVVTDGRVRHDSLRTTNTTTTMGVRADPPMGQRFPEYKDQLQSVAQVQQLGTTDIVATNTRQLPQYKDQVFDDENKRFGTTPRSTPNTAIASPHSRLPDYKDQVQSVLQVQQVRSTDVNIESNRQLPQYKDQVLGENDRAETTPQAAPNLAIVSPRSQLPGYKDQAQSVLQVQEVRNSHLVIESNSRLPQYKDQVMGENDRAGIAATQAATETAFASPNSRLPIYKDQAQGALRVQEVRNSHVVVESNSRLPQYKDQIMGENDRAGIAPTLSATETAFASANSRLPKYKDQAQSAQQVQEVRQFGIVVESNSRLPQYKDQVMGENDRAGIAATQAATETAFASPNSRLPNYKDQAQSALRVQEVRNSHVVVESNSRLPQYKDQVMGENDRAGIAPTLSATETAFASANSRLPKYKDQAQSVQQVQEAHTSDVVIESNGRLPQFKDQVMGENDRVEHTPPLTSSHSPSLRLPDYKDQVQSVLQVEQVRNSDVNVESNSRLPQYKDQVRGGNDSAGTTTSTTSDSAMASRRSILPDHRNQMQQVRSSDGVVDPNSRLPQYKDQVLGEHDRVEVAPTKASNSEIALPYSRLPEYKDQAQSVLEVQQLRQTDVVVESSSQLPHYKDQALGENDRNTPTLPTTSTSRQSESLNSSKQSKVQSIDPEENLPGYKDQAVGEHDQAKRKLVSPSVSTNDTDPAETLSSLPSLSSRLTTQRRQLADADDDPTTPALPPVNTNEGSYRDTNLEFPHRTDAATMAFAEPYVDVPVYQASDPIVPVGGVSYAEGVGVLVEIVFDDNEDSPETEETPVESPDTEDVQKTYLGFHRTTMLFVIVGVVLSIIGIVIGGICGSGACTRSSTSIAPDGVVPSLAPTQPAPTQQQPTVDFPIPFSSTNELYVAVDEFIDAFYGDNPRETDVTTVYGPIADWDVSQLTNLALVFYGGDRNLWPGPEIDLSQAVITTTPFNEDVSRWNISAATTLEGMFAGAVAITDLDLSNWDTRRVTSLRGMFHSASLYNGNLERWNVQSVVDFSGMFVGCTAFTGRGLEAWNVESGELLTHTFAQAINFNVDLSGWRTDKLKSLQGTFTRCYNFAGTGLEGWNISAVTSLDSMFIDAALFNADLSLWDTSRVTTLRRTFQNATAFNSDLPWDVSRVSTMSATFYDAESFNGDISTWDTSQCIDMSDMFTGTIFTGDISSWNTERVVRMTGMFEDTIFFNGNIGSWNVSNVVSMSRMFRLASGFNQDLSEWDVRRTIAMDSMFQGAPAFSQNLCAWGSKVASSANASTLQLTAIFDGATLCESTGTPDLSNVLAGPWCAASCNTTTNTTR